MTARLARVAAVALPFLALLALWQTATLLLPPYVAPPIPDVLGRALAILLHGPPVFAKPADGGDTTRMATTR